MALNGLWLAWFLAIMVAFGDRAGGLLVRSVPPLVAAGIILYARLGSSSWS